ASCKARSTGAPESCSTSSPCGATSSAAFEGIRGTAPRSAPTTMAKITSSRTRCRTLRSASRPRHRPKKKDRTVMVGRSDLLLDPRSLARQIAQVIELGAAHAPAALHGDLADGGTIGLEDPLDALAVRDLAHRERGVESAVAARDHDALVGLDALAVALHHLHLHDHGVARLEVRDLAGHALLLDFLNYVAHVSHLDLLFRPHLRPLRQHHYWRRFGTHPVRAAPRPWAALGRAGRAGARRCEPPTARAASGGCRHDLPTAAPAARSALRTPRGAYSAAPRAGPAQTNRQGSSAHRPARPAAAAPAHRSPSAPAAPRPTPRSRRPTARDRCRARSRAHRRPRSVRRAAARRVTPPAPAPAPAGTAGPAPINTPADSPPAAAHALRGSPPAAARASSPCPDRPRRDGHPPYGAR